MQFKKQQLEPDMEQRNGSKLGKEYDKAVFCHPGPGRSTGWNQDYWEQYQYPQICRWHHPYGRKQRRTEELLDEIEREWKSRPKTQHSKNWIMLSSSITSWQINGETVETVSDFVFLGSKITADGDRSHENKRCLLLGRKAMTNLDSVLKSRDVAVPTKVHIFKAMVFP